MRSETEDDGELAYENVNPVEALLGDDGVTARYAGGAHAGLVRRIRAQARRPGTLMYRYAPARTCWA